MKIRFLNTSRYYGLVVLFVLVVVESALTATNTQAHQTDHKCKLLNLSQFLLEWDHFELINSKNSDLSFSNGILYADCSKLNSLKQRTVCFYVLKNLANKFSYLDGKKCLELSTHKNNGIFFNSKKNLYNLYLPIPWHNMNVDVKQIIQDTKTILHCNYVPNNVIKLLADRSLYIDKQMLYPQQRLVECTLNNDFKRSESARLFINFERDVQILLKRRRRSTVLEFKEPFYSIDVKEDAKPNSKIMTLEVLGGSGKYIFTKTKDPITDGIFTVERNTGNVVLLKELNRDDGSERFSIDIKATDANELSASVTTSVRVKVLDVNDNAPIFSQSSYSKEIDEEGSPNKYILTVHAKDADDGVNREITYSIIKEKNSYIPFHIDPTSGALTNTEKLDRERNSLFVFKVKAQDHGEVPKFSTALVNIKLKDINDNSPEFSSKKYQFSIPESTKVDTVVFKVTATDKDTGSNGEILFNPLRSRRFRINTTSGEIILNEAVDFDKYESRFLFSVVAFDKGSPPRFANAEVEITIDDVNDNAPVFTRDVFERSSVIPEDIKVGSFVYKLSARDIDSGSNGEITFGFANKMPEDFPFAVNPKNGEITVIKPLDFERKRDYNFKVEAVDNGVPQQRDTAVVIFKVGNVNDNDPKFKQSTYRKEISEDTRRGEEIETVQAVDPDQLTNQDFEYSIEEGNADDCFDINQFTGTLVLKCDLDFKRKRSYKLKLKVSDADKRAGYAMFEVEVYDANNNAPMFDMDVYQWTVDEDVDVGTVVNTVHAKDDDSGENARITYSFQPGTPTDTFEIVPDTGEIKTKKKLDRESIKSYTLSLKASDHGKPMQKFGYSVVVIKVSDVNDNTPKFTKKLYEFKIAEDATVGSPVGSVSASDDDIGLNKEIRYNFLDGSHEYFSINAESGRIQTIRELDRETIPLYKFGIIAIDQGTVRLNSTAEVVVTIIDVQDSVPEFSQKVYNFSIDENSRVEVGRVSATLADEDFKHLLTYRILRNSDNMFVIDRYGIIRVKQELDYEAKSFYQITVQVLSEANLFATAKVNIQVNDVNDHSPVLRDFYIFINLFNITYDPMFRVPAKDKDASSKLAYSILSGNEHDFISLDEKTGEILLKESTLNTASELEIRFEVFDGKFSDSATGYISVSEVSDVMAKNSMLIVLNNVTKNDFLKASVLRRFKDSLAGIFKCKSSQIFIMSIEDFKDPIHASKTPMLEVAIAVRQDLVDTYMTAEQLKDILYLNSSEFEKDVGFEMVSFDFWNEYLCAKESCKNLETCSIKSSIGNSGTTSKFEYVTFQGVVLDPELSCKCPHKNHGSACDKVFNMCYQNACGKNGKCVPTDSGYACKCNPGYSGKHCKASKTDSVCPGSSPLGLEVNPCGSKGVCVTAGEKGFSCKCPNHGIDTELCTLSTRYFPEGSFIALKGMKRQKRGFEISFEFRTVYANAVLLYNGRHSNQNDFVAVQIVDGQVHFSVSFGKRKIEQVTTIQSFIAGGVNDGKWHTVKVRLQDKTLSIAVGEFCDIITATALNPQGKHKFCAASAKIVDEMKFLDLTAPMLIGGLPSMKRTFLSPVKDFVGCIRNLMIDHAMQDLSDLLWNHFSTAKCPVPTEKCTTSYCTKPMNGDCIETMNGPKCECRGNFVGERCQKEGQAVRLNEDAEVFIDGTKASGNSWSYSFYLKTNMKDGVILEETVNNVKGTLKLKEGYFQYYTTSTEPDAKPKVLLKLQHLFVANSKWHHVSVKWSNIIFSITAGYGEHKVSAGYAFANGAAITAVKLLSFGGNLKKQEKLVGCVKGFTYSGHEFDLLNPANKNVRKGCMEPDLCTSLDCGLNGFCSMTNGVPQCQCKSIEYKGPQCIDVCSTEPCMRGTCKRANSLKGYTCDCPADFTGENCETLSTNKCGPKFWGEPDTGLCGPCECRTHENFNETCDPDGLREPDSFPGKCFCNDGYYLSKDTCKPCACLKEGSHSNICEKKTGQCPCKPNVIGLKCDRCPGVWQEISKKCGEINNSCPRTYVDGIWWDRVPPGVTRRTPCPFNAVGNATRYCDPRKSWRDPNFFECTSQLFFNIKSIIKPMLMDYKMLTKDRVASLSYKLHFATSQPKLSLAPHAFYGKDIMIGYDALRLMIGFEGNQTGADLVSSDDNKFVGKLLNSTGMLFQPSFQSFWEAIQAKYAGTAGLMREMERFVDILSKNLAYMKRRRTRRSVILSPYSQATSNIFFEIQPITREVRTNYGAYTMLPINNYRWSKKYNTWKDPTVSIKIYDSIFYGHPQLYQVNIGVVIYTTLGNLLPKTFDPEEREKNRAYELNVYSDVVTLTIPNIKKLSSDSAIEITYKNVSHVNTTSESLMCAFWNYSLSDTISGGWSPSGCKTEKIVNTTDVICKCNHLTSFALVGIKYTEMVPRVYQPPLLIYLSLGVSMLLLCVVFLVFLLLRQLKSNANSIHKNLALVLFLGWLVFIFAINRPDLGKSNCRIIAIVIHYCLTCSFSWLMVESLHMYRMILEPRDINYGQMMFYYFIGWGAPVIVVGVTAGLKPTGYGNDEFCWVSAKDRESIWTYVAPIMAIIAGNLVMIMLALSSSCERVNIKRKKAKLARIRYRLGTSLILLFIIITTVVAGLLAVSYDEILFTYIFGGACVLEGIYLFLFYVILNRKVRREMKNAYIRFTTNDKSYGLKPPPKRHRNRFGEREALIDERYAHVFEAFNLDSTSSNESSDAVDGRRRARKKFATSDTTSEFPTTANDSSDSSDEDSTSAGQKKNPMDSDSDLSDDDSSGIDEFSTPTTANGNGYVPHGIEWKQATQKKLAMSRTYASDGPMHSTPSESDTSERKWKMNMSPSKKSELSAIQSESDAPSSEKRGVRKGPRGPTRISSSNTDSDTQSQSKTPVSILKKKSQYDSNGHRLRAVRVKDSSSARKPLMSLNDTSEFNDSQV